MSTGGKKSGETPAKAPASAAPNKAVPGAPAAPAARRPPGAKEVPPFEWKLVGYSRGIPLTLLKSVERHDVEAQFERYQSEGYYTELAIHPIDAKIPIPKEMLEWISSRESTKKVASGGAKSSSKRKSSAAKLVVTQTRLVMKPGAPSKAAPKTKAGATPKKKVKTKAKGKSAARTASKSRTIAKKTTSSGKKKAAKRTPKRATSKKKKKAK